MGREEEILEVSDLDMEDYHALLGDDESNIQAERELEREGRYTSFSDNRLRKFWPYVVSFGKPLVPSFVYLYSREGRKLHNTSSLDGLRGVAAFFVMIFHYSKSWMDPSRSFTIGDKNHMNWYELPIIRIFWCGDAMVLLFFVISGYVLSLKSIKCIRQRRWDNLLGAVSSSVFRRAMRLFGPAITVMVIEIILLKFGLFEFGRKNLGRVPGMPFLERDQGSRDDYVSNRLNCR